MTERGRHPIPKAPPLVRPSGLADLTMLTAKRRAIALALEYCDGDIEWAAEELAIDRTTLWRHLKRWESARPPTRPRQPRSRKARLELVAGGTER